jgi:hypothetical protein
MYSSVRAGISYEVAEDGKTVVVQILVVVLGIYVGPQIGMAPESLWGLPNLEY